MDRNRIMFDCFPSLHTSAAMLLSWGCYRYSRRIFWLTLPIVALTPLSCVYLRYHYVVDCIAGIALTVALMLVTPRVAVRE
jgi:membrane-associated phospholipid phosphatase